MNPLNWLASGNDDPQDNEPFDTSLVLPLTVGLGTVVVSALLGYRGRILGTSKTSLINKPIKDSSEMVSSSREVPKRKSIKSTAKPKASVIPDSGSKSEVKEPLNLRVNTPNATQQSATSAPIVPNPILPTGAAIEHPKPHSKGPSSPSQSTTKPKPEPSLPNPTPSENRKPKKTKRSSNQEPLTILTPEEESTEIDTTWVTVIPKKVRPSATGPTPPNDHHVPVSNQPSSISNSKKKSKHSVISEDNRQHVPPPSSQHLDPVLPVPIIPSPDPTLVSIQHPSSSSTTSQSLKKPPPVSQKVKLAKHEDRTAAKGPNHTPGLPTSSSVSSASGGTEKPTTAHEDILCRTLGPEAGNSVRGLLGLSESPAAGTAPPISKSLAAATHLPAANELYTRHLSAQVEAKEAECQLLRSEIIHLREEVKRVAVSAPAPCPHPSIDVETMTEPLVETEPQSKPKTDSVPTPHSTKPSNQHRSQSPDTVLLRTLQDEIARLAKEITISHQRNENLEARLATTTKQLNMTKNESVQVNNALQKELNAQTQRADRSEEQRAQMEVQLQELLQQTEIQRRKTEESEHVSAQQLERVRCEYNALLSQKDQWEQERTGLLIEKDRLVQELDMLNSKHSTVLNEMDSVRRNTDDLRQQLQDAEIRVQSLDHERTSSLRESNTKITQLESELTELRAREQEAIASQVEADSKLVSLSSKLDQVNSELAALNQRSADERVKIAELEHALHDERAKREQSEIHLAEAMRTHPHAVTEPVVAEPRVCVDATTQADPEPSAEYEPSLAVRQPVKESTVQAINVDESSALPVEHKFSDLEAQVAHYKSALDVTECMLSKLQSSVDEEEQRWREALGASKMECELLELKIAKLESTVSTLTGERDELNKTIQQLQLDHQFDLAQAEHQSTDGRTSAHSLSVARIMDTVSYDENTPKAELIRLLNRFRCLVQIEHETLKREQANCARLQSQLSTLEHHKHNGTSNSVATITTQPVPNDNTAFDHPLGDPPHDTESASPSNGVGPKAPPPTKLQGAESNGVSDELPPQASPNGLECELNGTSE